MGRFLLLGLVATACAPTNYVYNFDLIDPGARNLTEPGERDSLEDADLKTELLLDPTSFQAIALDITNKTEADVVVQWDQISIVGPDGSQSHLRSDTHQGNVQPGAKVMTRLVPFVLPSQGALAAGYDNTKFELVIPMLVRGQPHEYRYHLLAKLKKL